MRKCVSWWPVHHLITRAKHAVIMGISSFLLRQGATLFSDGTGLVSRAGPPPERRSVNTALLKTRNRLPHILRGYADQQSSQPVNKRKPPRSDGLMTVVYGSLRIVAVS